MDHCNICSHQDVTNPFTGSRENENYKEQKDPYFTQPLITFTNRFYEHLQKMKRIAWGLLDKISRLIKKSTAIVFLI